jgi:UDP-glucose 4-epimerase
MKMLDAIDRGEPLKVYGDGSQAYDFVYVTDCAKANVCAMKADTTDRLYNVGTGRRTSIKELAEMLVRLTGTNQPVQYEPGGQTFVKNRIGSPVRAKEELDFEASIDLEAGLEALIAWRSTHKTEVEARRRKAAVSLEQ